MKKLFLHIGFNKTGSTSTQHNLAENADALRRQGIFYPFAPDASYGQRWQHVPLAAAVPGRKVHWLQARKRPTLENAWDDVLAAIAADDCPVVVLSSEAFSDLDMNDEKVAWVQERLSGFDVTVLAYIRRQDSYFISTYQELIKAGAPKPFHFNAYPHRRALQFAERLAPWRRVFGTDRVVVRPFDPRQWPEGELFFDVLDIIGADRTGMRVAEPANEGLDRRAVEMLRQLNQQTTRQLGEDRSKPRWRQHLDRHRKLAIAMTEMFDAAGDKQKMSLSSQQIETLRAHFRQENIAALEGSGIDVDAFFPAAAPGRKARLLPETLDPALLLQLIVYMDERSG